MSQPTPQNRLKRFLRGLFKVFLVYVLIVVILMFLENYLIYHPVKADRHWNQPSGSALEEVWMTAEDGTRIHGWWCPVADARWVILYCHGNAGNLSHRLPSIQNWQRGVGVSVFIFDYPGFGKSAGSPNEESCYAAGRAAYDWLIKEKRIPPDKLVILGKSLGAGVALYLAENRKHGAVVLVNPFTSVPDMAQETFWFLPARWMVRTKYDNRKRIQGYKGPLFITHGDADEVVPFRHGQELYAAANSTSMKRFHVTHGGEHNDLEEPEMLAAVRAFLDEIPERGAFAP